MGMTKALRIWKHEYAVARASKLIVEAIEAANKALRSETGVQVQIVHHDGWMSISVMQPGGLTEERTWYGDAPPIASQLAAIEELLSRTMAKQRWA